MSKFTTLTVQKRNTTGKGANRRLRAKNLIPAVFYSPGGENIPVQVPELPLMKTFEKMGRSTIFNIEIVDGDQKTVAPVLLWDLDLYPTKNRFMHVDFFGIDLNKELKVRVPLEFVGVAIGTKTGGSMEVFHESLDILCKPLSLPSKITIDVSNLEVNQSIRVSDLELPEGVSAALEEHITIVSVTSSSEEDAEGEGGESSGAAESAN